MPNFDPAGYNYYGNPTQANSWMQQQPQPQYGYVQQYKPVTNVSIVTSLEEALIKTTERNSDMVHFHQDKNEFYRVKVDNEGRKSWAAFPYNAPNQNDNTPATKADIKALIERIEALEGNKKEVIENAEPDGHGTVFTFDTP